MRSKAAPHPLPLSPYRVLDLTEGGVNWAGRVLADLGADVIKLEPPAGSPARRLPPFATSGPEAERSLWWHAYCVNKRSVILDLESEAGRQRLQQLARTADVLIESLPPRWLDERGLGYERLRKINPALVYTSVTPFGSSGPYATHKATDLTLWSMGGATFLAGSPGQPPVRVTMPQAELHAGAQAAAGTLIALWERIHSGMGQHVDVSIQSAVVWTLMNAAAFPPMHGANVTRGGPGGTTKTVQPCKNGFINAAVVGGAAQGASTARLVRWMGEEGSATERMLQRDWPSWDIWEVRRKGGAELREMEEAQALGRRFFAARTKAELFERAVRDGIMLAPCNDARDIWEQRHLRERKFFVPLRHPDLGRVAYLGPYVRLSKTPIRLRRPAPRLGEHTSEILRVRSPAIRTRAPSHPVRRLPPFQGLRVLDLSWVGVGPVTTRYLADHGATVIRVESVTRPDPARSVPPFKDAKPGFNRSAFPSNFNANKLGLGLNMAKPAARWIIERLLREWKADVLAESFSPGAMARWRLDWKAVRRYRPDLVYFSTTQMGQTGPHAAFKGYGTHAAALAGLDLLTGWPDRPPDGPYGAYTDFINPPNAIAAVIAALEYRRRTGKGQHVDLSQFECAVHYVAPVVLNHALNGAVLQRDGNRDWLYAPQGVYPCSEKDTYPEGGSWCALSVTNQEEWRAFCRLIGRSAWARDPELSSAEGRRARHAEIDAAIAAWTSRRDRHKAMALLQRAGVPAGAVQKGSDLWNDPQLTLRRQFQWLPHTEAGPMPYVATQFQLSATPGVLRTAAPLVGEHNEQLLRDCLGMTDRDIAALLEEGVLETS